jgi:flagellar biosynthesis/type III secretory pathway chaperone
MQELFQKLIAVLAEELRVFSEFRALFDREKEPIQKFDAAALDDITNQKRVLQTQLHALEQRRRKTTAELAAHLKLDPETLTLRKLAEFANDKQRETLLRAREVFNQLADDLNARIADNGRRIDRSLWLVRNLRRMMVQHIEQPATYEDLARDNRRSLSTVDGGRR